MTASHNNSDRSTNEDSSSDGDASANDFELSQTYVPTSGPAPDTAIEADPATPLTENNTEQAPELPSRIGRYTIERLLGRGGYGNVYLARDTQLERRVALKVPHKHRLATPEAIDLFLQEARTLASLDHPSIVPIYDFDRWEDTCYVVSKFIDGETLTQRQRRAALSIEAAVELIHSMAMTLHYVHLQGVVHRDFKPSNLLVEQSGKCYLTDFGLALRDVSVGKEVGQMGTISYMSPEQARGESHLVDGRSDLFSLGIVLYELLTGLRPFTGENWQAITVMICYHEPKPLRQRVDTIPKELERVCLKLLSKRATDRYLTAKDLADDLQHFLKHAGDQPLAVKSVVSSTANDSSGSSSELVGIIPRGLRSFSREDSLFFRQLLPGPRDREGLPDSLQVWKRRIESREADETFRVGVIYGPSGSGKSSFIKAGLLPLLEDRLINIFVEASAKNSEDRLLDKIRTQCPDIPPVLELSETLLWIRNSIGHGQRNKVLIVIDQFEQWLNGWDGSADAELAVAMRQSDGQHLQIILLVRDDFWLALSRFSDLIEIDLVAGRNLAMVDLFDKRHARKVLAEYGRGHARLPARLSELSKAQSAFLDQAVEGLAEADKVIPIQISAFSEIMKGRDWDVKSLQALGGVKGVGVRFLEEAFSSSTAPAHNRAHEKAAQAILQALLPDADTNIRGAMRSEAELIQISGYSSNKRQFDQLIHMLDIELRLITPGDASNDADAADCQPNADQQRHYQLTHDFLVPAVRNWLSLRQQSTLAGRTALRLADRTEVWTARPQARHLPSWLEWVSFLLLTRGSQRDSHQQRMMGAANRRHGIGTAIALVLVGAMFWAVGSISERTRIEDQTARANAIVAQLTTSTEAEIPAIIDELSKRPDFSQPPLIELIDNPDTDRETRFRAQLATLRMHPDDSKLVETLTAQLSSIRLESLPILIAEVQRSPLPRELMAQLWSSASDHHADHEQRFRSVLMLAALDPPSGSRQTENWGELSEFMAGEIINRATESRQHYNVISTAMLPARDILLPELRRVFGSDQASPSERQAAANLILTLLDDSPTQVADVYLDALPKHLPLFSAHVDRHFEDVQTVLQAALSVWPTIEHDAPTQERLANRQANAAAMLLRHDQQNNVWPLLSQTAVPNARSALIERLSQLNVDPKSAIQQLQISQDDSTIAALLLSLGSYHSSAFDKDQSAVCEDIAKRLWQTHASPLVHSSAEWFLKQFHHDDWLKQEISRRSGSPPDRQLGWRINHQEQTLMRLPLDGYTIELGATEVTFSQFRQFRPQHRQKAEKTPYGECPANQLTWLDAVQYCRWLTIESGMTEDDQCYPKVNTNGADVRIYEDYRKRKGYRLPIVDEWEKACFDNVITKYPFGERDELVFQYAWLYDNSDDRTHRVGQKKPTPFGLFDMLGNASEWCSGGRQTGSPTLRALRGAQFGSLFEDAVRLTQTGEFEMNIKFYSMGFRLARTIMD